MAISNSTLGQFLPRIRYDEPVFANSDYITKKQYTVGLKKDGYEHIKWCRRNMGNRGDGWDFVGSGKSLTIFIWSHKLQFMYEMWQQ